jgi:anti-sigma-K factor RskA
MSDELTNQSQLLLYLAGELPEASRERLERTLEQDASLRSGLDALRSVQQSIDRAMLMHDAEQTLPESQLAAATRQTARLMRQWQVDRAARPTSRKQTPHWRLDWRAYSVVAAIAAVMFIGFTVWWQNSDHGEPRIAAVEQPGDPLESFAVVYEQTVLPPAPDRGAIERVEHAMDELRSLTALSRANNLDSESQ